MRIISQDGSVDFSYEVCYVWILGSQILATLTSTDSSEEVLATYSTRDKVEMVMRKLRDNYAYNWKIEHGLQTYFGDEPCVFQFPQEEEI